MKRERVHSVDGHKCTLPLEEELICLYVYEGVFVNLRRRIRTYLMINNSYPETKSVFKSTAQIYWEKARHLRKYYYMIHPFSEGRASWETVMIVVYLSLFFLMPLEIVMIDTPFSVLYSVVLLCLFCIVDIILYFFTGYFDKGSRRVILNPRKVFLRYIFGLFLVDLVSSIPYNLFIYLTHRFDLYYLKYLYFFKLFRLPTLLTYMKKYCIRLDMWNFTLKTFGFGTLFVVVIWWGTTYVYIIYTFEYSLNEMTSTRMDTINLLDPLSKSCMQVVRTFTLISISNIQVETVPVQLFYMGLMFGGCVLNLIIFTQIMQIYRRYSNSRNKYNTLVQEIGEYMNYKEQPLTTRKRVLRYVGFKYQKNMFKEEDILNSLSRSLQQEVILHNCKRLVQHVEFFKNLPTPLIIQIINKLRSQIYLSGDLIVQAGSMGNAMYFIHVGTVAVYSVSEREICHLEDGNYFGEISLIIRAPRVASVVAITDCEVLRLSRKDFLEIIEPYPSVSNKMRESALSRLQNTQNLMALEKSDNTSASLFDEHEKYDFFSA